MLFKKNNSTSAFVKAKPEASQGLSQSAPYNILFIGGSNSVMNQGFVPQLTELLRNSSLLQIDKVENISVGASSCTLGLERILKMPTLGEYDIFFIEYTINDLSIYSKDGGDVTWRYAYEGLIRIILSNNQNAIIVPLIFGRLHEKSAASQMEMRQFIQQLQPVYNLCIVDNDELLRDVKASPALFRGLYLDGEHYNSPYATGLIAHQIYYNLLQYLHNHQPNEATKLPQAVEKKCFDNIASYNFANDYKNKSQYEIANFTNSRYQIEAIAIPIGGSISVDLPSPAVALSFISAQSSCSLLIDVNGEKTVIDTLHRKVREGDFNFLYKNFTFTDSRWKNDIFRMPTTITLKAIGNEERADLKKHYKEAFNMISNQSDEIDDLRVHLSAVVYVK
jgi:hypothetical protein